LDISLSITFLENFDVRLITGEDDSDISLSITFLETVDVRVKTGKDASDISLSIIHMYTGALKVVLIPNVYTKPWIKRLHMHGKPQER
jgi:hypothetical protein